MIDDFELEWMASLDWSAHGPAQRRDVVPVDYLPMATVLLMLAQLMIDDWPTGCPDEFFLRCAGLPPRGRHPIAEQAFGPEDRPIRNLHAVHGAAVRAAADACLVEIASPDVITKAEWDAVDVAIEEDSTWGVGARRVWSSLAPAFADAVAKGEIETYARPVNGGEAVFLHERFWALGFEMAARRAASCRIALRPGADPFDAAAPLSHGILVPKAGLRPIIEEVARANYATHMDLAGIGRLRRPIDDVVPAEERMRAHLVSLMRIHDPAKTSRDFLRKKLNLDFDIKIGPRPFKRIWRDAIASDSRDPSSTLADYARAGPKRRSANAFCPD